MENNENGQNKNALIAIVLSAFVLFGWNYFFPAPVYETENVKTEVKGSEGTQTTDTIETGINVEATSVVEATETFILKSDSANVEIDNRLAIVNFGFKNTNRTLKENFPAYKNQMNFLVDGKPSNEPFVVVNVNESIAEVDNGTISGSLKLNEKGQLEVSLAATGKLQIINQFSSKEESKDQRINSFVRFSEELESYPFGEDEVEEKDLSVKWFGLDYNYHLLGYVYPKNQYHLKGSGETIRLVNLKGTETFNYKVSFLKKNYDELNSLGDNLHNAVDFGIWSVIALPMLRGLQYFYSLLNNWGLAIIVLTIIIRMLMFPLQHSSFKSMKKMQVLQPDLKKIREKYKEDPQRMQQETMALFKKHGANPMGGCLPLFLQMPIFFAFYRMLYNSVELVDAPFYFWIHDLSEKDPFYVLPVLMGIAMFFNMKLTPSSATMDPAQQKVMKFMPIIFSLFLFTLPSGLNLYILVSTLVGMAQQIFVYKRTPAK